MEDFSSPYLKALVFRLLNNFVKQTPLWTLVIFSRPRQSATTSNYWDWSVGESDQVGESAQG